MLNLLFLFIAVCIVIGIIRALLPVIIGVIIVGVAIATIIYFGPVILSWIISVLPILLVLLAALFLLGCVITLVEKQRHRSKLKKLDQLGIEKIDSAFADWQKMNDRGWVEITPSGYVISISFYKNMVKSIGTASLLTVDKFRQYCLSNAKDFRINLVVPLLEFLQNKGLIFPFQLNNGEFCLLTKSLMSRAEDLFSKEGAATENEFMQICEYSGLLSELPQNDQGFVPFFLNYMLSCGKLQKIELNELSENLYVSNSRCKDSKLVRREISLD